MNTDCAQDMIRLVTTQATTEDTLLSVLTLMYPLSEVRRTLADLQEDGILWLDPDKVDDGSGFRYVWHYHAGGFASDAFMAKACNGAKRARPNHRHDRETVRLQRERITTRRRRQFAGWLGEDHGPIDDQGYPLDPRPGPPRPLEIREAEFWAGRREGLLAKFNGQSMRRTRRRGWWKTRNERRELELLRELQEHLTA